jgi:hypothetical protein
MLGLYACVVKHSPDIRSLAFRRTLHKAYDRNHPTKIDSSSMSTEDVVKALGEPLKTTVMMPSNGNKLLAHIVGIVPATRITVKAPVTNVF